MSTAVGFAKDGGVLLSQGNPPDGPAQRGRCQPWCGAR